MGSGASTAKGNEKVNTNHDIVDKAESKATNAQGSIDKSMENVGGFGEEEEELEDLKNLVAEAQQTAKKHELLTTASGIDTHVSQNALSTNTKVVEIFSGMQRSIDLRDATIDCSFDKQSQTLLFKVEFDETGETFQIDYHPVELKSPMRKNIKSIEGAMKELALDLVASLTFDDSAAVLRFARVLPMEQTEVEQLENELEPDELITVPSSIGITEIQDQTMVNIEESDRKTSHEVAPPEQEETDLDIAKLRENQTEAVEDSDITATNNLKSPHHEDGLSDFSDFSEGEDDGKSESGKLSAASILRDAIGHYKAEPSGEDAEKIIWQGGMRLRCGLGTHYCLIYVDCEDNTYNIRVHDTHTNVMLSHAKFFSQKQKSSNIIASDIFTSALRFVEVNVNGDGINVTKAAEHIATMLKEKSSDTKALQNIDSSTELELILRCGLQISGINYLITVEENVVERYFQIKAFDPEHCLNGTIQYKDKKLLSSIGKRKRQRVKDMIQNRLSIVREIDLHALTLVVTEKKKKGQRDKTKREH
eukprot:g1088.t1